MAKHIAVKCFDLMLSKKSIDKVRVGYIAVACICIAGKFDDSAVTKIIQYRNSVSDSLKAQGLNLDLNDLEIEIMQTLDWNIAFITPFEVAQCAIAMLGLENE